MANCSIYVQYLTDFKQLCQQISVPDHISRLPRRQWKVRELAEKYQLGLPVAGTFFQAEWDEWVPHVHKQLGIQ